MTAPEQRGPWWPGLGALAVLAVAVLAGRTVWYADQWREWVLASEPGFVSPGMDAAARLPAGTWFFEWVMRPWSVGPTPWRALPALLVVAMLVAWVGHRAGRRSSMGVTAAVLLPPFALFAQSGLASAAALGLVATAWALAAASHGRRGWGFAAVAAGVYPAAVPALAATAAWRLLHLRRAAARERVAAVAAMVLAAAVVFAAYWVAGTAPAGYLEKLRATALPAALVHVAGGPILTAALLAVVATLLARVRLRELGATITVAWLVAGVGVIARSGPWSLLQPAFVLSGLVAALVPVAATRRGWGLLIAGAVGATVVMLATPPTRQWRAGSLVDQWSDIHLPAPVHEVVLRWDAFLLAADDARAGAEPMGEFGLPVRWALEFEAQTPQTHKRLRLETDIRGPWCEEGHVCSFSTLPVTSLAEGPVLVQFLLPRRLPTPLVPAFVACGDSRERVELQWQEVRVVDLYNMLGIVGRIDLPAGCHRPDFQFLQGEWQTLQMDAAGIWRRLRGSGQRPHEVRRF